MGDSYNDHHLGCLEKTGCRISSDIEEGPTPHPLDGWIGDSSGLKNSLIGRIVLASKSFGVRLIGTKIIKTL